MAQIVDIKQTTSLGTTFKRTKATPIDDTEVFSSIEELQSYARKTLGGTAYVGQICSVVDKDARTAKAYIILNTNGDIQEIGSTSGEQFFEPNDITCEQVWEKHSKGESILILIPESGQLQYISFDGGTARIRSTYVTFENPNIGKLIQYFWYEHSSGIPTRQESTLITYESQDLKINTWDTYDPTRTYPTSKLVRDSLDEIQNTVDNLGDDSAFINTLLNSDTFKEALSTAIKTDAELKKSLLNILSTDSAGRDIQITKESETSVPKIGSKNGHIFYGTEDPSAHDWSGETLSPQEGDIYLKYTT